MIQLKYCCLGGSGFLGVFYVNFDWILELSRWQQHRYQPTMNLWNIFIHRIRGWCPGKIGKLLIRNFHTQDSWLTCLGGAKTDKFILMLTFMNKRSANLENYKIMHLPLIWFANNVSQKLIQSDLNLFGGFYVRLVVRMTLTQLASRGW